MSDSSADLPGDRSPEPLPVAADPATTQAFVLFSGDPERTALVVGPERIAFGELGRRVESEAAATTWRMPVVLPAEPSIAFVVRFLSLLRARCPVAVVSAHLTPHELQLRRALLGSHILLDRSLLPVETVDHGAVRCHPDTALILFTSGSTGTPKAVQLSASNIAANSAAVLEAIRFDSAPQQHLFLSLSYSYGLLGQLLPALQAGVPTCVLPRFIDARSTLIPGRAAGMWSGVPSQWKAILGLLGDIRLPEVTHVVSAGAPLPLSSRYQLHESFPRAEIYNNYGLTEASPRVLCMSSGHPRFFTDCTGLPVRGIETRLTRSGEFGIRGPQVMLGYLGDPDGTAAKISDGWLLTGDHAEIDGEGMVTIHGREDRIINLAGERTSLQEIETALLALSGIADATVLVEEDEMHDWRVVAFLVAKNGDERLSKITVLRGLSKRLSPAKIPRLLFQLPRIPLNQHFKTDHGRLQALRKQLPPLK